MWKNWSFLLFHSLHILSVLFYVDSGRCYSSQSGDDGLPWTDLDYDQVMSYVKSGDIQLFDVREPGEVQETGMMPKATNLPRELWLSHGFNALTQYNWNCNANQSHIEDFCPIVKTAEKNCFSL